MADLMVEATQKWLHKTYGNQPWFPSDVPNERPEGEPRDPNFGSTGWHTINPLMMALQHELGIASPVASFGPTTTALYGANPLQRQDGVRDNKFAILQGALWCKGYDPGHYASGNPDGLIDDRFDAYVEAAVVQLKTDMGLISPNGVVTTNVMKALLSMDAFKLLNSYGGRGSVRSFQQYMNRTYEAYIGLMPCDGVYGRNTNVAVIKAIQAEEGIPVSLATGNIGDATKRCLPQIPYDNVARNYSSVPYTAAQIANFTKIMQFCIVVNSSHNLVLSIDGNYTTSQAALREFQMEHVLSPTGICDLTTWLSLISSAGDTTRTAKACDTSTILTNAMLETLKGLGYETVGRYLTGTVGGTKSKALTHDELQRIYYYDMGLFAIYQDGGTEAPNFTSANGTNAAQKAIAASDALGLPTDTVIYFAVDFDAMDVHITNNILPHFAAVKSAFDAAGKYHVGIYGARNVCTRVANSGYSESSFVSDMSTGFSGNLGFAIPSNWAYDQFANVWVGVGEGRVEIDKVAVSRRATPHKGTPTKAYVFERHLTEKVMDYIEFTKKNFGENISIPYYDPGKNLPYPSTLQPNAKNLSSLLMEAYEVNSLASISETQVRDAFANITRYGVDCSGFTYACLNEALGGLMQPYFETLIGTASGLLTYTYGINADNQTSLQHPDRDSVTRIKRIDRIRDMQPGDLLRMDGSGHVVLLYHMERDANNNVTRVDIAHSSGGYGPHLATISVTNDALDLKPSASVVWDDVQYNDNTWFTADKIEYVVRLGCVEDYLAS